MRKTLPLTINIRQLMGILLTASLLWSLPTSAQDAEAAKKRLALMGILPTPERLVQFAAQGDTTVLDLLLQASMDVNASDPVRHVSALHNAAAQGHLSISKSLIERGADVNATDWRGNTPLINAAYFGHLDVVKVLLEKSANINAVSNEGITALSAAIYSGKEPVISYILSMGADPALPKEADKLPLTVAQRAGRDVTANQIQRRLTDKYSDYR
jgi:ankyrin repeat protein